MNANTGEFAKKIIESIDDLFTDHVGPIASILTEEAFTEWQADNGGNLRVSSLKTIRDYINRLAQHIDTDSDRQAFLEAVYSIDAIKYYSDSK